jgi:cysteinyl-tRNA synthetase
VDDKTIAGSKKEGISLPEFTARYKKAFFEDLKTLNVEPAEHYPDATAHIPEMVEIIQKLLKDGYAYESAGSIYYKISAFPGYGSLPHFKPDELKAGARIAADSYEKEEVGDFALWKGWDAEDGDVFWETPLGKGRPGWHIECSAMSMKYLGPKFDIHTGGVDNIFPHHENERAQSDAFTGAPVVNYWLHSEHLVVEGKKMSKSLGNFFTLRDLLARGCSPMSIRYLLLSAHYRMPLNFTFEGLAGAKNALERLYDFQRNVRGAREGPDNVEVAHAVHKARENFEQNMDDDLNVSGALGVLFDFVRDVNRLSAAQGLSKNDKAKIADFLSKIDSVLGYLKEPEASIDNQVEQLIAQRNEARRAKDFARSDSLRAQLEQMGIILEDTPQGTKWKKKL